MRPFRKRYIIETLDFPTVKQVKIFLRESSFRALPSWLSEAEQHLVNQEIPRMLVGTKNDLDNQEVSRQRAQRFADSNFLPLFEVSAKSDHSQTHVNAIFLTLAHKLKQRKQLIPKDLDQVKSTKKLQCKKIIFFSQS